MSEALLPFDTDTPAAKWRAYHAEHPEVYELFRRMVAKVIARGLRHYSARTIWHVMRFHTDVRTNDAPFKLNNNYTPYYARLWMSEHPQFPEFFELRRSQADDE